MPFVRTTSAKIHYEVRGEAGPAVVLLQGLGLSSRFWFDVPDRLRAHAPRRVVLVDNRGTGRSGRPPLQVATMADDVALVLDDAGLEGAIVVGISMGGMIAQHVALRHPARVKGLLLLATSPGAFANTLPSPATIARLISLPFRRSSRTLTRLLLPESKWGSAREIFRDWPNAFRDDPTHPATFAAHLIAASTHYAARGLPRIACPVIVAAGTHDVLIPRENAESLARRIPDAELELVEGAGHALIAEDRELVCRLVARLEARIEAAKAGASV
jgi:pimeloyl-ACP methyl ester carboxylesterase